MSTEAAKPQRKRVASSRARAAAEASTAATATTAAARRANPAKATTAAAKAKAVGKRGEKKKNAKNSAPVPLPTMTAEAQRGFAPPVDVVDVVGLGYEQHFSIVPAYHQLSLSTQQQLQLQQQEMMRMQRECEEGATNSEPAVVGDGAAASDDARAPPPAACTCDVSNPAAELPPCCGAPECKSRRVLANRQSAQRSRMRKLQFISALEGDVARLQREVGESLAPRLAEARRRAAEVVEEHSALQVAAAEAARELREGVAEARRLVAAIGSSKALAKDKLPAPPRPTFDVPCYVPGSDGVGGIRDDDERLEAAALAFATTTTAAARRATAAAEGLAKEARASVPRLAPVLTGATSEGAAAATAAADGSSHSPSSFLADYHAAAAAGVVVVAPSAVAGAMQRQRQQQRQEQRQATAVPCPPPAVAFSLSLSPPPPQQRQPQLAPVKCASSNPPLRGVVVAAPAPAADNEATIPSPSPFGDGLVGGSGGDSPFAGFAPPSAPMTPVDFAVADGGGPTASF